LSFPFYGALLLKKFQKIPSKLKIDKFILKIDIDIFYYDVILKMDNIPIYCLISEEILCNKN